MKKILIFRHGETDWNAEGRFQGHIDVPLNDRGRAQATALIPILREQGIEVILSSDLSRARETGQIVASSLNVSLFMDAGIREAFLGEAQGRTYEEIEELFGTEITTQWGSSHLMDADVSYPGGETGAQVVKRVFETIENFLRSHPYRVVGVSSHGGVIRRMLQRILPPGAPAVRIPNTVLYELGFDEESGKWFTES